MRLGLDLTLTNVRKSDALQLPVLPHLNDQSYTINTAIAAVQLPEATGIAPLSYALAGLPAGLMFNAVTRTLSGTPSVFAVTTLTYTATDANGATANQTFEITVNAAVVLPDPTDQSYTINTAIAAVELPAATGGTGDLSYALAGLPAGLMFNALTRTLSGTPSVFAVTTLTYTATDANGATANQTFEITVNAAVVLPDPTDQSYTINTAIAAVELPVGSGGTGNLSYALAGLPAGLMFNALTRTLSGTPSVEAVTTLTYTATDANGATANQTFDITVNADVVLPDPTDQSYTINTAIAAVELPAATGGTGDLSYALAGLPAGLMFNALTRTLSGTPSVEAVTTLTYTATDANGATANQTFDITVNAAVILPDPNHQAYTINTAIAALELPAATGGTGDLSYALAGLPAGLMFNAVTRTLSGTPSVFAVTTLTYTATDANGATANQTFEITVNAAVVLPDPTDQSYTINTAIAAVELPAATGGTGDLSYALAGLPAGLMFNALTRTLSGTPSVFAVTTLTYTATDANGATANQTFEITVNAAVVLPDPTDQSYTINTAIAAVELPVGSGGTGNLSYALAGLPAGLMFNALTRTLSGTPSVEAVTTLTYTATDANGATANQTFDITVNAAVILPDPNHQAYTINTAIAAVELPVGTGGTAPLSYALAGLPAGLMFNAVTRTLSGAPSLEAATLVTYTATDANGATANQNFFIIVAGAVILPDPNDQSYTINTAIAAVELPAATGGTGDLSYALAGLPAGLMFNAVTRTLSGTPSVEAVTTLTYTATDANGATANQTFDITVTQLEPLRGPLNRDQVKMLLHFDYDSSDYSVHNRVATLEGAATIDTGTKVFGEGSMQISGAGDTVSYPASNDFRLDDSVPFQLSWRMRRTQAAAERILFSNCDIEDAAAGWSLRIHSVGFEESVFSLSSWGDHNLASWAVPVQYNTWKTYRLSRDANNNYRLYVDGILAGTRSIQTSISAGICPFVIGGTFALNPGPFPTLNFDEVLFEKHPDLVVSTTNAYVVQTAPHRLVQRELNSDHTKLLLHLDSDFADSSINNRVPTVVGAAAIDLVERVLGDGSMSIPGSGDMISFPASPDFNMGDSIPFQLSWRMRRTQAEGISVFFAVGDFTGGYILSVNNAWTVFGVGSNGAPRGAWPYSPPLNEWVAYRFNHDGANNYRWYADGVLIGVEQTAGIVDAALPFVVGGRLTDTGVQGNIDEVLFEKHADLVVTTTPQYDVEIEPFALVQRELNPLHTQLLLHFDSNFADSSPNNRDPRQHGSPEIDNQIKVFGEGSFRNTVPSNLEDGRISFPVSSSFHLGQGTPAQISWRARMITAGHAAFFAKGSQAVGYVLISNADGTMLQVLSNGGIAAAWDYSHPLNEWVAHRFNHDGSGTYRWYVNGTLLAVVAATVVDRNARFMAGGSFSSGAFLGNVDEVAFEKHADLIITTSETYDVETKAFALAS